MQHELAGRHTANVAVQGAIARYVAVHQELRQTLLANARLGRARSNEVLQPRSEPQLAIPQRVEKRLDAETIADQAQLAARRVPPNDGKPAIDVVERRDSPRLERADEPRGRAAGWVLIRAVGASDQRISGHGHPRPRRAVRSEARPAIEGSYVPGFQPHIGGCTGSVALRAAKRLREAYRGPDIVNRFGAAKKQQDRPQAVCRSSLRARDS